MAVTDFGTRLRALRKARGLTQRDVAQLCGVTIITVSNWEVGRVAPWPKNQERLLAMVEPRVVASSPALGAPYKATPQPAGDPYAAFTLPPRPPGRLIDNA